MNIDKFVKANSLRGQAQHYRGEADRLIAQYGQGVRPSWVSAEVSIARHKADLLDAEADQIEKRIS